MYRPHYLQDGEWVSDSTPLSGFIDTLFAAYSRYLQDNIVQAFWFEGIPDIQDSRVWVLMRTGWHEYQYEWCDVGSCTNIETIMQIMQQLIRSQTIKTYYIEGNPSNE